MGSVVTEGELRMMPAFGPRLVLLAALVLAACSEADVAATTDPCPTPLIEADPGRTAIVRLPMRDCARLVTSVHFPTGAGPWPVILVRTPYGRGEEGMMPVDGAKLQFVPRGYVVVSQDVRGRFGSDGEFVVWQYEGIDGADTLAWIERQPWFNGRVGVWGASYLGFTAIAAAAARPDLVQAAVLQVTQSDFYRAAYEHGVIRADTAGTWLLGMAERDGFRMTSDEDRGKAVLEFPLNEADRRTIGEHTIDDAFMANGTDSDWYRKAVDPADFRALDTPIYMAAGWFDFMVAGQLADWNALVGHRAGRDLFLTIGPWTHVMGTMDQHDFDFPDGRSLIHDLGREAVFFDRYLKDADDAVFDATPVAWYDGGRGVWSASDRLWPAATRDLVWYAAEISGAHGCAPLGTLSSVAATRETQADWIYDPHEPIHLNGGQLIDFALWGMRREINWCAEAAAVLESEPLTEALEIAGTITVSLRVAVDTADSSIFTRLYLVDADGQAYNLREGAMLLSHREGDARKVAYSPGERVTLDIPLAPLRWTLQPGQRLGLAVAGSGYPLIVPHTNTAGDWTAARDPQPTTQSLYAGQGPEATVLRMQVR